MAEKGKGRKGELLVYHGEIWFDGHYHYYCCPHSSSDRGFPRCSSVQPSGTTDPKRCDGLAATLLDLIRRKESCSCITERFDSMAIIIIIATPTVRSIEVFLIVQACSQWHDWSQKMWWTSCNSFGSYLDLTYTESNPSFRFKMEKYFQDPDHEVLVGTLLACSTSLL